MTAENMDRLSFRGKPGEMIDAVIKRGDKEMPISLARGKISYSISKADMVEWMENADGDDWGDEKFTLHEAVGVGNVVYVWTEIMNTDDATGQPVETHVVTRFQFNDDGKVAAIANMREDTSSLSNGALRSADNAVPQARQRGLDAPFLIS